MYTFKLLITHQVKSKMRNHPHLHGYVLNLQGMGWGGGLICKTSNSNDSPIGLEQPACIIVFSQSLQILQTGFSFRSACAICFPE